MNDSKFPPDPQPFLRTVRSFVLRAGRTTAGQAKAFSDVGPRFLLPYTAQPLDFATSFERQAPTILEIGFGMGEATAQIAELRPHDNFLCCEVHEPGVGALLKRIGEQGLEHIRILQHDAVEVIEHMLAPQSLAVRAVTEMAMTPFRGCMNRRSRNIVVQWVWSCVLMPHLRRPRGRFPSCE